jgi:hypothetical protein
MPLLVNRVVNGIYHITISHNCQYSPSTIWAWLVSYDKYHTTGGAIPALHYLLETMIPVGATVFECALYVHNYSCLCVYA